MIKRTEKNIFFQIAHPNGHAQMVGRHRPIGVLFLISIVFRIIALVATEQTKKISKTGLIEKIDYK
ncbi:hypothetical protein BpHYR1_029350 [Brachionus plicatilis]|uniref:Uncharacterized protein n=1 Tax=Brachionus plicatilis TaxID=10195 RepID=A0A3M7RSW5_BRAPC|nr:hypothetical protein BpHYR1_029350 [Brachionus plicatilis]